MHLGLTDTPFVLHKSGISSVEPCSLLKFQMAPGSSVSKERNPDMHFLLHHHHNVPEGLGVFPVP